MEDSMIIKLYWERSESAIKETHAKYGKLFKYIAMNILSDKEDADECVNDTYLSAWNIIPPQKPDSLSAFLCKITRNIALKKYEYINAKKRNPEIELSLSELEGCISITDNIQDDEKGQIVKSINEFLRTLDYESRNVFLRRYWYFDSVSSIANRFHMSRSKVTSMLFRTRNKLKAHLEKERIYL